jgi:hypothetical protein
LAALVAIVLVGFVSAKTALPRPLDIPRSYLSRGYGKFVSEEVAELVGEVVGVGTA